MKFKTFGIQLLITLLLTLLIELTLSFFLNHPGAIPVSFVRPFQMFYKSSDRSIIQVTDCAQYDSGLFYMLKPGRCSFKNREFDVINHVNSMGLRDDEQSLNAPSIVALGDSYTMGWGIPEDETFPTLLEGLLNEKVLNAGVSSFGTAREMKLLKRLNLQNPHYVVIQYHANDYEENIISQRHHYDLPIRTKKQYDSIRAAIEMRQRYYPFKYLAGLMKAAGKNFISPDKPVPDTLQARMFLDILMHSPLKETHYPIVVFKIDDYDKLNDQFADAVDALLKKTPYTQLNISTVRISQVLNRSDYFILDDHINPQGHRKLAKLLTDHLRRTPAPVILKPVDMN